MSKPEKPDPVVKEETGRAAIDFLVKGLSDDARASGSLPNTAGIEKFAHDAVTQRIKVHEERLRNGEPVREAPVPKAEIRRPDDVVDVERPLGTLKWDDTANEIAPGQTSGRAIPGLPTNPVELRDHIARQKRLELLRTLPDWQERLLAAYFEGARNEIKALSGKYTTAELMTVGSPAWKEIQSAAADAVCAVVDASSAVFGDWRNPGAVTSPVTVDVPFAMARQRNRKRRM